MLGVTDKNSFKKYAVDGKNGYENFVIFLEQNGYERIAACEGKLEIYERK